MRGIILVLPKKKSDLKFVGVTTPLGAVAAIIGIDTRSIWRNGWTGKERNHIRVERRPQAGTTRQAITQGVKPSPPPSSPLILESFGGQCPAITHPGFSQANKLHLSRLNSFGILMTL